MCESQRTYMLENKDIHTILFSEPQCQGEKVHFRSKSIDLPFFPQSYVTFKDLNLHGETSTSSGETWDEIEEDLNLIYDQPSLLSNYKTWAQDPISTEEYFKRNPEKIREMFIPTKDQTLHQFYQEPLLHYNKIPSENHLDTSSIDPIVIVIVLSILTIAILFLIGLWYSKYSKYAKLSSLAKEG